MSSLSTSKSGERIPRRDSRAIRQIIVGFVLGVFTGMVVAIVLGLFVAQTAERQLIDDWRKIRLGMSTTELQGILGEPSGSFSLGSDFPEWAVQSVPRGFSKNHGLMTYVIPKIRPQVLLIYTDEQDRVAFVSSVPT